MFSRSRKHANRSAGRKHRLRRGTATVEFAFCLPALIVLTIGTIDLCSMMFLKESITLAAYEGSRRGVGRGRTNGDVTNRITQFLNERNIDYTAGNVVTFSSPDFNSPDTLDNVTTTVTVPCAGNLLIPSAMFGDMDMTASVTIRKEYKNLPLGN